jgi:hypothetical protein
VDWTKLWGHETGTKNRFKFQLASLHHFYSVKTLFTLSSITGKTTKRYTPRLIKAESLVDAHIVEDGAGPDSLPVAENSGRTQTICVHNSAVENGARATCSLGLIGANDGGWDRQSWREWRFTGSKDGLGQL